MLSRRCTARVCHRIVGLVLLLVCASTMQGLAEEPEGPTVIRVNEVQGQGEWIEVPTEVPGRWKSRFPANPDRYRPMSVPAGKASKPSVSGDSRQVVFDVKTRQQTYWTPASGRSDSSNRGRAGHSIASLDGRRGLGPLNFSDLTGDFDATQAPWSANCRIFATYEDETGEYEILGYTSGVLVNRIHVLTSATSVYLHDVEIDGRTFSVNDWAREVIVVPGYHEEMHPYGHAAGAVLSTWEEWATDDSSHIDIAIIRLNRPIGLFAGSYGCRAAEDPNFYTENVFGSAGYPDEEPYDGQHMYYWEGSFDHADYDPETEQWIGNRVSFDRPMHMGQAGSGAFLVNATDRRIYAVASASSDEHSIFARLGQTTVEALNEFAAEGSPAWGDLMPLNVQVEALTVKPGQELADVSFLIHNNSYDPWTGRVEMVLLLSDNKIMSGEDTYLAQFYMDWTFAPRSVATLNLPPLLIPSSTKKGNYWLGAYLSVEDSDPNNNITDIQDVAPIAVGLEKLTNGVPALYTDGPKDFALDIKRSDWCCIGIHPSVDYDLKLCEQSDFLDPYAESRRSGTSRDFVVVNGHWFEEAVDYARVAGQAEGNYWIEATWNIPDLKAGREFPDVLDANEVYEIYEMDLEAGTLYQLTLDVTSGTSDVSVYIVDPTRGVGTASAYSWMVNRDGQGQDEELFFIPIASGYHAIVVVNENAEAAEFTLDVKPW